MYSISSMLPAGGRSCWRSLGCWGCSFWSITDFWSRESCWPDRVILSLPERRGADAGRRLAGRAGCTGTVARQPGHGQTLRLRQRAAELQRENNTARYTALQQQLNPHFLFNSLNTLIAEIEYDPARAVSFTRRLSEVYRYVLQVQDRPLVTLGEELRFADAYLYLHPGAAGRLPRLPDGDPRRNA